jgi:MoxR-like ATPase
MSVTENRSVTPSEARSRVLRAFKAQRPVFLWGPPGIGKSELVAGLTEDLGGHMIDLRLGQMEPTDIRGIPFFNKNREVMDWAPPVDLPDEELASQYPIVVLFLDEMNSAAPAVQAAGYQLILNRRIGKYRLPDNVVIVAAGNRESDKGVTYRMPSPLANRFVHLEVRPDFDSWFQWAVNNQTHQDVVGYLSFAKQDLMDFNPKSASRAFATPRSWTFVSQFLQDTDATDAELADLIAGTVGDGLAVKFMAHRKVAGQMPNPSDVLSGKVKELKVKEVSAMYSLTISMCYELQEQFKKLGKEKIADWHAQADNFLSFMMTNFTTELVVMGARVALTTYNLPMVPGKMKNFDEFHKRFGKYIIAASGK